MKACISVLVILAVVGLGIGFYFFTGRYNVAATSPHWDTTLEVLETVRDQSIMRHSKDVPAPPSLADPGLQEIGFHHYHEMCRLCHGAPGYDRNEFAEGLYPNPPKLSSGTIQKEWDNAQLYWIVDNGLKMTGMPSFGVTHNEHQMWGIIAFLRILPDLSSDKYHHMVESASKKTEPGDHHHGGDGSNS